MDTNLIKLSCHLFLVIVRLVYCKGTIIFDMARTFAYFDFFNEMNGVFRMFLFHHGSIYD